MLVWYCFCERQ